MPKKVGNVEIHMGPQQVGAPDDLEGAIVGFIKGAKKRLDIAVQELDSVKIAREIVEARMRGVSVRLVTEMNYLRAAKPATDPFAPLGQHEVNRQIQNTILRSAIPVYSDFNPGIFHQKFIIRDGSAVLTGSTNFTDTGTSANLNHLIIVHDRKVANTYGKEFREIRQGRFGRQSEGLGAAPREVQVGNVPIKILFAPDHNPEMEIMKQMAKAKKRIDFAVFTFAKSSGIDDVMVQVFKAGTSIRGVFDGLQAGQKWAATKLLNAAGIPAFVVRKGAGGVRKLHHKLMVLDEQVIIAGSFNYTRPANLTNDENILVIGDLDTTSAAVRKAQTRLAKYALDEIDRIVADHAAPLQ
ncbi:MAG: phospholipase D-like domain-containing protein [Bacteroidota bacterium]